jgi:hypothetical protein
MHRTQFHLYYCVLPAERVVRVLAFWHTARGRLPSL